MTGVNSVLFSLNWNTDEDNILTAFLVLLLGMHLITIFLIKKTLYEPLALLYVQQYQIPNELFYDEKTLAL